MGWSRFPCERHFSLRFDGDPVSMSKLVVVLSGSGERVDTVARRCRGGVATAGAARAASSPAVLFAVAYTEVPADDIDASGAGPSAKIWLAARTRRGGRREDDGCALLCDAERETGASGSVGSGVTPGAAVAKFWRASSTTSAADHQQARPRV